MLPTGHIAAGFLTAFGVIKILKPDLGPHQVNQLCMMGAFWGFAPDLDVFYSFAKQKSLLVSHSGTPIHRKFFFHAPMVWLILGLSIFLFGSSVYLKTFGLIVWLASWSHFVLDSIEYGIMWLWPWKRKIYALWRAGEAWRIEEKNFFKHSFKFLYFYSKRISFYLEIVIILSALIILL